MRWLVLFISFFLVLIMISFVGASSAISTVEQCDTSHNLLENTTSNERDMCYSWVASIRSDDSICDRIENTSIESYCHAVVRDDVAICDSLKNEGFSYSNGCYLSVAMGIRDPNICEKIDDGIKKDNCLYLVAVHSIDLIICDRISDQQTKVYCLEAVDHQKSERVKYLFKLIILIVAIFIAIILLWRYKRKNRVVK